MGLSRLTGNSSTLTAQYARPAVPPMAIPKFPRAQIVALPFYAGMCDRLHSVTRPPVLMFHKTLLNLMPHYLV
jgi:hypothetical protein